ncbi:hypothetical protein BC937DRAFT_88595 [Endogone sp. FLAS-F59071]|nr:hypothetical protein BC937DRAFT_88595 [Endogone sp. FLAS-F59071]|eukprot:RUS18586.1 hypothetical protein BC937DRAFT_88595 [Endogone sp. FLAS-F59071]
MSGGGNIKVVVRCRPLNSRELARGATMLIRMEGNQTIISTPDDQKKGNEQDVKPFTFDKSYWSADKNDPTYADQQTVYNDVGEELLDHAFDGYNCYGQTGSGKSYSMMGYGEDKGIIPRTCEELFNRISRLTIPNVTYRVEVSYIEIYNEKVRDLLNPKNKGNLKVREHPSLGPYVEDLSRLVVNSFADIEHLMDEGNKARTVAATNMNETSSRSHAVFTLFLTQKRLDELTKLETEKVARISLVDLAGSERANSTGATGQRLKEGANINKSLTSLGKVIAGLAEQSMAMEDGKKGKKAKEVFIPYRDSVLTWLLKDSLGGNSKTTMIAAISPADYDETLSTLRYADQAKKIKNKAVVNEDPNAKLIRELKEELDLLRSKLMVYAPEEVEAISGIRPQGPSDSTASSGNPSSELNRGGGGLRVPGTGDGGPMPTPSRSTREITITDARGVSKKMTREEVIDQLESSEKLLTQLNETWEAKMLKTEEIQKEREKALEELGIAVEKNTVGVYTPKKIPHLVNLNEDPLMSECLVYQIKPGITRVGRQEGETPADIRLSGSNILDEHCYFDNKNGTVTLHPLGNSMTMVNGMRTGRPKKLKSGFRIILGDYHVFRFNHPEEVRRERDLQKSAVEKAAAATNGAVEAEEHYRPDSPTSSASVVSEVVDWNYAKREAVINYYSAEKNFGGLKDEELEKLFDDITKIRNLRRTGRPESRATDIDDDTDSNGTSPNHSNATMMDDGSDSIYTDSTLAPSDMEEKLKLVKEEIQQQLELQKLTYEDKIRIAESSGSQSDELKMEKAVIEDKLRLVKEEMQKMMDQQREEYETKIQRMSMQMPLLKDASLHSPYSEREMRLIDRILRRWKEMRYVQMAETVLTNAVVLKEANIISKELGKQILYQFVVIEDGQFSNPLSFWESTSALSQFNNSEDTQLVTSKKPCIGVKVIDHKHQVVYLWSLEKLKLRLHRMRNLYNFIDRPLYRKHFNWEDPFYENPCPRFTFIGSASVSLRNLLLQQSYESEVDVIDRHTGAIQGVCRILIVPISTSAEANGDQLSEDFQVSVGQQMVFEVQILDIRGLSEKDYTQVQVQFKLSSFGNVAPHSTAEKIFATDPVSDFEDASICFSYTQTLSMTVSLAMMEIMKSQMLTFEVYGHAQQRILAQVEKWDDQRERPPPSELVNGHRNTDQAGVSIERRSEDELLSEERHDVLAWVQVCELTPDGEYVPVQVLTQNPMDTGVFLLRQGLQRRIVLTLNHTSGRQFLWTRVSKAVIGRVRFLDPKSRIIESPPHDDTPINLLSQQRVVYNRDGTSSLTAQGAWDSSLHESLFLNRITAPNSRVLLTLQWWVEAEKCLEPIRFEMDIAVQIQGRDATKIRFLGPSRYMWKSSGIFLVNLKPPMTRKLGELWRLNTASKYVRGEEFLGSWRPRGVSLVIDYKRIIELIKRRESVDFTKQILDLRREAQEQEGCEEQADGEVKRDVNETELCTKVIALWNKKFGTPKEILISQDPPVPNPQDPESWRQIKPSSQLIAEVKIITQTDNVSKKGYLMYPENADDVWVKRWFVIRSFDMFFRVSVANAMCGCYPGLTSTSMRKNVFAIYTNNNAYLFQATNRADMVDWISKIDQFYPVNNLVAPED